MHVLTVIRFTSRACSMIGMPAAYVVMLPIVGSAISVATAPDTVRNSALSAPFPPAGGRVRACGARVVGLARVRGRGFPRGWLFTSRAFVFLWPWAGCWSVTSVAGMNASVTGWSNGVTDIVESVSFFPPTPLVQIERKTHAALFSRVDLLSSSRSSFHLFTRVKTMHNNGSCWDTCHCASFFRFLRL